MTRLPRRTLPVLGALAVLGLGLGVGFARPASPAAPGVVNVATANAEPSALRGGWAATPVSTSPTSFLVADAAGPQVTLFTAPDQPLAEDPVMDNPTWEGLPVVFAVLEDEGPWLHVRVSRRPNHFTAWVRRSEVTIRTVPNRVVIEVGARRVTVYHGDEVLLQESVAVGRDATPTPLGTFFVDGAVDVPDDDGPYGAFQVSVSGFSEVLRSFGGGIGQIAMHGTNRPQLLGQAVSNGCVRMDNDTVARVVELATLGTPVTIVA